MPKYHMDFNGTVYRDKMFNSEKPVYVIDAADWERMVELSIDSQVGHRPAIGAEIKAIIEKVKAANG